MKITGIIAEYNPFHTGHQYHIHRTREITGCGAVVAVMSGNWVQRGDMSVMDKETRAKCAVECGVDLSIEYPAVFAAQSAEFFAFNAVYTLHSMGIVNYLSFGAEHEDLSDLTKIAEILSNESTKFKNHLKGLLDEGMTYAAARSGAVKSVLGEDCARILDMPNNILAVEYLKALIKLKSHIQPVVVKRFKAGYHETAPVDGFASASLVRNMIREGDMGFMDFIPIECRKTVLDCLNGGTAPNFIENMESQIITALLSKTAIDFKEIWDVSEGMENRIANAVFQHQTLNDIVDAIKTKRYTKSRIRRVLVNALLGITKDFSVMNPQYIKPLYFNSVGQSVLKLLKESSSLKVCASYSHIKKMSSPEAEKIWNKEALADRIYMINSKKYYKDVTNLK